MEQSNIKKEVSNYLNGFFALINSILKKNEKCKCLVKFENKSSDGYLCKIPLLKGKKNNEYMPVIITALEPFKDLSFENNLVEIVFKKMTYFLYVYEKMYYKSEEFNIIFFGKKEDDYFPNKYFQILNIDFFNVDKELLDKNINLAPHLFLQAFSKSFGYIAGKDKSNTSNIIYNLNTDESSFISYKNLENYNSNNIEIQKNGKQQNTFKNLIKYGLNYFIYKINEIINKNNLKDLKNPNSNYDYINDISNNQYSSQNQNSYEERFEENMIGPNYLNNNSHSNNYYSSSNDGNDLIFETNENNNISFNNFFNITPNNSNSEEIQYNEILEDKNYSKNQRLYDNNIYKELSLIGDVNELSSKSEEIKNSYNIDNINYKFFQ